LVVIDAANVVGSVPDGWWRDRAGATERLRDALAAAGPTAVPGADDEAELVLVVEGAVRGVKPVPGVRVVAADRGPRERVEALGARVVGRPSARLLWVVRVEQRRRGRSRCLYRPG
jgi:hypothetical protein